MKQSVVITLGAGVFTVVLGAYLFAYATTVREPVEWHDGDVIVQDSRVEDILPVFEAVGGYTHVGVVEVREGGAVVIESADKVRETPMREFLARSEDGAFAVYRLNGLSPAQGKAVVAAARRQIGKPNDYFLRSSWEQLYSSELVKLAFRDAGIEVGHGQRLGRMPGNLAGVESQFSRKWAANEDCSRRNFALDQCWAWAKKQEVVTPASIVEDSRMTKLFEAARAEKKGFTLSRAGEKKDEAPQP